jgi:hypothetical protein
MQRVSSLMTSALKIFLRIPNRENLRGLRRFLGNDHPFVLIRVDSRLKCFCFWLRLRRAMVRDVIFDVAAALRASLMFTFSLRKNTTRNEGATECSLKYYNQIAAPRHKARIALTLLEED